MSKFAATVESLSHSAAIKYTQPITSAVQEMATNAGWASDVIDQLSVVVKDRKLTVSYPSSISKKVQDLEYGTESEPPKPVLRRFEYALPEIMQPYLEKELDSRMAEVVNAL